MLRQRKGRTFEDVEGRGGGDRNSDREVCNAVRGRELWSGMCAGGMRGKGECKILKK